MIFSVLSLIFNHENCGTFLLLFGHHGISSIFTFLVLPLLWAMASHLYYMLSTLIDDFHFVLCLICLELTCILACLLRLLLQQCLGSCHKFIFVLTMVL